MKTSTWLTPFTVTVAVAFAASVACTEDPRELPPPSGADAAVITPDSGGGGGDDAGGGTEDAGGGSRFEFQSRDPAGAALVLRSSALTATSLDLDVVGVALAGVHGISFRVSYDPAQLRFDRFERGRGFPSSDLVQSAEPRPGLLLVALGQFGPGTGYTIDPGVVASISFTRLAETPAALRLERGYSIDPQGFEIRFALGSGGIVESGR